MKAHAEPATDDVILVDEENKIIGRAPKFVAHTRGGLLHRAFSVVTVDNQKGSSSAQSLNQSFVSQHAIKHMLFPSLASIPSDAEGIAGVKRAACRRYQFELGVPLQHPEDTLSCVWIFRYAATSPVALSVQTSGREEKVDLCEHEIDYVLLHVADSTQVALINDVIKSTAYNKDEVSELLWANTVEIRAHWEEMTPWFRILLIECLSLGFWIHPPVSPRWRTI